MSQRKCCVSCVGGITEYGPISEIKQLACISSAEVPRKLCGWYARQDYVNVRKIILTSEYFDPADEVEIQRGFSEKPCCHTGVLLILVISNSFSLYPPHTYISANKRKRKKAECIFIHQHFSLSLLCTTVSSIFF